MIPDSDSARQVRWARWRHAHDLAVLLLAAGLAVGAGLWQSGERGSAFAPPSDGGAVRESAARVQGAPLDGQSDAASPRRGSEPSTPPPRASGRLSINTADVEALQALPGVGRTLAERIVAVRQAHGPFQTEEELFRVPGIGPKRFERIRPLVRVQEGP
jgi:competence ComEA-like helix-hairpin-helix protein